MSVSIETIVLGMGCFWGAEKRMAAITGVIDVESGYANGEVAGDYETVLKQERLLHYRQSTLRNHAEVVRVSFDRQRVDLQTVLARFWESHDPTQGNRQGNDIGTNYRSAVYFTTPDQEAIALTSRAQYQIALSAAGHGAITTEITRLQRYHRAEEYHQDYLRKNPHGYCGLGGCGIPFPADNSPRQAPSGQARQLIAVIHEECDACQHFKQEILTTWSATVPISSASIHNTLADIKLERPISVTPTIILSQDSREISRFTGYRGNSHDFWHWLGTELLSAEQQRIAFHQGTERPFSGKHLDEHRSGLFTDPITGAPLFRSESKFESGCGWPSFFTPIPGALSLHEDTSHGMHRVEVRSASSGIHLGHVFNDGPPPTGQRYCINGNVLGFIADTDS